MRVTETMLPGVGVRHDFDARNGQKVGVVVHRDGRREVVVFDDEDPDVCHRVLELEPDGARTMAELLGASQVTEAVEEVRHNIEGLALEWIELSEASPAHGQTIEDGAFRTRTGASIIAVMRESQSVPAPLPDFELKAGDTVVATGTDEGLAMLRSLLR